MTTLLAQPLTLPCGLILPNRLVKAAMTEGLADGDNRATARLTRLYQIWGQGGAGLQLTGNVLVDRRYLEAPGNVVIEEGIGDEAKAALREWAEAARAGGGKVVMQVSHAGRQTPGTICERPVAPSDVPLEMPGRALMPFGHPRALTSEEVDDVIKRFVFVCRTAEETGFDGVQIHAAHGYLLSQFLSPKANRRTDKWGGSLENRSRLLMEIIRQTRQMVSPSFAIGVKLNAADFQQGGFTHDDCLDVVDWLNTEKVDFIEITGGNYEQPQMMGMDGADAPEHDGRLKASTVAREAYFVEYANAVRDRAKMPVMATGGFRTSDAMEQTLSLHKADLIGMARPFCVDPDVGSALLEDRITGVPAGADDKQIGPWLLGDNSPFKLVRMMNGFGRQAWYLEQIARIGEGDSAAPEMSLWTAITRQRKRQEACLKAYRSSVAIQSAE